MTKAINDLDNIIEQFETFERKMLMFEREASKKHGETKTAEVLDQIVKIRDDMRRLRRNMSTETKGVTDIDALVGKYQAENGINVVVHSTIDNNAYATNGVMECVLSSMVHMDKYGTGNIDTYIKDTINLYPVHQHIIDEAQGYGMTVVGVYTEDQEPLEDTPVLAAFGYTSGLIDDKIKTLSEVLGDDVNDALLEKAPTLWCSRVPDADERKYKYYKF